MICDNTEPGYPIIIVLPLASPPEMLEHNNNFSINTGIILFPSPFLILLKSGKKLFLKLNLNKKCVTKEHINFTPCFI